MTATRFLLSAILSYQSNLTNEPSAVGMIQSRNEGFYFSFSIYCIPLLHGVRDDLIPSVHNLRLNPL